MECPFRSGKGLIQYNPEVLSKLSDKEIEDYLKAEMIRILLKHPYERQPHGCKQLSKSYGSNLVLTDNYITDIKLPKPDDFGLPENQSFEWYTYQIEEKLTEADKRAGNTSKRGHANSKKSTRSKQAGKNSSNNQGQRDDDSDGENDSEDNLPSGEAPGLSDSSQQGNSEITQKAQSGDRSTSEDLSTLWEEDELTAAEIDLTIEEIDSSSAGWGNMPGNMVGKILANTKAKIDYRKVLSGFRASVISSKRHLTRMRPNRRSGFENMGSIRRFNTNLLIAVDVSGSISDKDLQHFYSVINRVFKYGIETVSVVQFDFTLKEVMPFKKAKKEIKVIGRGGTSFQPIFDFLGKHREYDGVIIFTDGWAQVPIVPKGFKCKVVWVCTSKKFFETHKEWMRKIGRSCYITTDRNE